MSKMLEDAKGEMIMWRERARLLQRRIDDAPHGNDCPLAGKLRLPGAFCTCWKSRTSFDPATGAWVTGSSREVQ